MAKVLRVFSLTMINIIAIADVRTLPIAAEYGPSLLFYYLLAGILFFLPCALVVAELVTTWPKTGGLYVWVREALGVRVGFLVVWLQWLYNVVWYPTILSLLAATLCYLVAPHYANNPYVILPMVVVFFWLITGANCFGMRVSSWISSVGTLLGVALPLGVLCLLAVWWLFKGGSVVSHVSWAHWIPSRFNWHELALLSGMLFGLLGIEMSAAHASEVANPARDYPRALIWTVLGVLLVLVMGSLAVALVIPKQSLSLTQGVIQSFAVFFNSLHVPWLIPVVGACILIGGFSAVSAWLLGTSKCLFACADDGVLPTVLARLNRYDAPVNLLLLQAVVVTVLSAVYLMFQSVESSYWLLSAMTSQLALIVYVFLFISAIVLRYRCAEKERPFSIPGGKFGMWCVAGIGLSATLLVGAVGFLPPSQLNISSPWRYECVLVGGVCLLFLLGLWFACWRCKGRSSCV